MHAIPQGADRLLRERQVLAIIPVSRSTLWRWVDEGKFPEPHRLTPGVTVWREAEVLAFLQTA